MRLMPVRRLVLLLSLTLLVAACGKDNATDPTNAAVPDFVLTDVNPNSATALQPVSPRDYLQKVSAWYFGHAT